tara:strand:- start:7000 stop:8325 length:1326 start_codon:yes stop_codon:yes gene_type:complete
MSFPTYRSYKDSGVEWVGQVPSDWQVLPLRAIVAERNEPNAGMIEDNLLSLSYGRIIRKDITTNDGLLPASFETYQVVHSDDIVFRLTDLQNDKRSLRTAIVSEKGIITSAYLAVKPVSVSPKFLSYLLRSYDTSKVFYSMGGGLRQSMKYADIKMLPVAIPDPEAQLSIVAFLDHETAKIDALVEEQRRLIELLKEKRQAVISHAVTKGLNPNAPMKDSGIEWLGKVPEHWNTVPLKYLVSMKSGGTPSKAIEAYWDGKTPWASAKDLKSEVLSDTEDHITNYAINEGAATLVQSDAVLVVVRGMILARTFPVALTSSPMAINQDLKALIPSTRISSQYLAWYLRGTTQETLSRLDEAGHGTKALRMDAWASMEVAFPDHTEQKKIVKYVEATVQKIDALITQSEKQITLLQERRTALISSAVTGKIDVRNFTTKTTEAA